MNIIEAITRETKTKGDLNTLRAKGEIPAVIYGGKDQNQNISFSKKVLKTLIDKENFLSNIINIKVERPLQLETTALGAAILAGVADGKFSSIEDTALSWNLDRHFNSNMAPSTRRNLTSGSVSYTHLRAHET